MTTIRELRTINRRIYNGVCKAMYFGFMNKYGENYRSVKNEEFLDMSIRDFLDLFNDEYILKRCTGLGRNSLETLKGLA